MSAYFGPGGNSDAFRLAGFKSTLDAPAFVKNIGLDAYEYEAGNGLAASPSMLAAVGKAAKEVGVKMSFHTPYFISLSGVVEEKRLNSIRYIRESLCHKGIQHLLQFRQCLHIADRGTFHREASRDLWMPEQESLKEHSYCQAFP